MKPNQARRWRHLALAGSLATTLSLAHWAATNPALDPTSTLGHLALALLLTGLFYSPFTPTHRP